MFNFSMTDMQFCFFFYAHKFIMFTPGDAKYGTMYMLSLFEN